MSLQAHTNAWGDHTMSEPRYARSYGVSTNWNDELVPFEESWHEGNVKVARSIRPDGPTKGDHVGPTFYGRQVRRLTEDTPFQTLKEEYSHGGTILRSRRTTVAHLSVGEGSLDKYPIPYILNENDPLAEADTKALNALGDQKAQLGAMLAEARQTVDLLANAASRGAKVLLALKRGQLNQIPRLLTGGGKGAAGRSKDAANAWLEYAYGWKPLADDLYGIHESVLEALTKKYKIRGKGYGETTGSTSYNHYENEWNEKGKVSVKTTLIASIDNQSTRSLHQIGLTNPLSVAWELVPWSFAIDWFIPVGNTLEACTATYGLVFDRGWRNKHFTWSAECQKRLGPLTESTSVIQSGRIKEEGFAFFRDPLGGFPRPQFYADTTPFSTPRVLNALALVRQLFK
jgi:hypothetical protein